ncbi:hypothetical protein YC2023_040909 [Brassica napus]
MGVELLSSRSYQGSNGCMMEDKNIDWFPNDVLEKYFTDFGEVLDEKYEQNILKVKNILIDVIGQMIQVDNVDEVKTKGKGLLCDTNGIETSKNWNYCVRKTSSLKVHKYGEFLENDGTQPKFNYKTCGDVNQTRFLIFDQIAENILGRYADHLIQEYKEENLNILDHIPIYAELPNSIVGKKISFNVSLKGDSTKFGYSPYLVDCYLDDQNIIDEWL